MPPRRIYKVIQGLLYSPCKKKNLLTFQLVKKKTVTLKAVKENLGATLNSIHWNSFMVEDTESTVVCLKKLEALLCYISCPTFSSLFQDVCMLIKIMVTAVEADKF